MFHILFWSHISTVSLCLELVSSVLWWESLNSCKATTGSSTGGKSSAIEPMCVYAITTVKRTWDWGWSSLLCIIFFQFRHRGYFTDSPKTALPQPKQKHIQGALSKWSMWLDIRSQYWTDLNGIALKNNKLNVAMADMRHWGLVLICILYTAVFLLIFLL